MELIKIYHGKVVDARELHQFLGVKRDFSTWIKDRIKKYGFEENVDYTTAPRIGGAVHKGGGHNKINYALTINMAKELSMVENNEQGRKARKYFIEAEQTLRKLADNKRLAAFSKLESTKENLLNTIKNMGGHDEDYIQVDMHGRQILFNGEPLPDEELSVLLIKGRDFATETTNLNIKQGNFTMDDIHDINGINHKGVREYIIQNTGRTPESLPKEKNLKDLENTDAENKKLD